MKSAKAGKHFDGGGLIYFKRPDGGGQFILRVALYGRRREMGLGGYPDISLADARELAQRTGQWPRRVLTP